MLAGDAPFTAHLMMSSPRLLFGVAVAEVAGKAVDVDLAERLAEAAKTLDRGPGDDDSPDTPWTPYADGGRFGVYVGSLISRTHKPGMSKRYVVAVAGLNYALLHKAHRIQSRAITAGHTVREALAALEPVRLMAVENRRRLVAFVAQACGLTLAHPLVRVGEAWPVEVDRNLHGESPARAVCRDVSTDDWQDVDDATTLVRSGCCATQFRLGGFVPVFHTHDTMTLYAWDVAGFGSDATLNSLPCEDVTSDDLQTLHDYPYVSLESRGAVEGVVR